MIPKRIVAKYFSLEVPFLKLRVCTDSRLIEEGDIFFALRGERFDAFNFAEDVAKKGAFLVVYEAPKKNVDRKSEINKLSRRYPGTKFYEVPSALGELQRFSHFYVEEWKREKGGKVFAITGSNGKTTVKDMVFHLFSDLFSGVRKTEGNFNNHIGVPLTLCRIDYNRDQILIVEMGMNHPGEIHELCKIANPDAGLITSIGRAHIEFFDSIEGIFLEKKSLFDYIEKNSKNPFLVYNADDIFLRQFQSNCPSFSFSAETEGKFARHHLHYKKSLRELDISLESGKVIHIKNENIFGRHNLINLSLAAASALMASEEWKLPIKSELFSTIENSLARFKPRGGRSEIIEREKYFIYLDAYNANPDSMKNSIESFVTFVQEEKKLSLSEVFFILGDMNELGRDALRYHRDLGELSSSLGIQKLAFVGRYFPSFAEGFFSKDLLHFPTSDELKSYLSSSFFSFAGIRGFYIKGSNSLQLESLTDII